MPYTEIHGCSLTSYKFNVCHPEVFNTYTNIRRCVSQTEQNFVMFIIVLRQHVSILIESSSGPSKERDPYLKCLKMRCGIPNAYILDKTMYKMHVLFGSYCTVGIFISKTSPVHMKETKDTSMLYIVLSRM